MKRRAKLRNPTKRAPFTSALPQPVKRRAGRTDATQTPASFRAVGLDRSEALRDHVRERLGFRLGKFASSVSRVTVRVFDVSGHHGKPTKACEIKVMLHGLAPILVEERARDAWAAVDVALDRVERAVRSALTKRTKTRKVEKVAGVPVSRQRRPARRKYA